eukprot:CAMPEP_0198207466 /NCGR_PEP_ID=MMETSP1445-20131203/10912_1 /TAXON_ID=36898 /ORGANISM="Pyramimonas sp., Strain CCMP2087" /LENGTH=36 /DNA_ID= /DNA_START= /DNA_END= /DNA_ORIENTATION=
MGNELINLGLDEEDKWEDTEGLEDSLMGGAGTTEGA